SPVSPRTIRSSPGRCRSVGASRRATDTGRGLTAPTHGHSVGNQTSVWFPGLANPERRRVMGRAYNVIDSDGHILEPLNLWENYIDPVFRDRAPRLFIDEDGKE